MALAEINYGLNNSWILTFSAFFISLITVVVSITEDASRGRIPEFDDVIAKYAENIAEGKNMHFVVEDLKITSQRLNKPDQVMLEYYTEVCKGIGKVGDKFILSERERMNTILSNDGASEDDHEYAYQRRNVLESFIDSAAQAVMLQFNMDRESVVEMNQEQLVQKITIDDIDFAKKDGKPKTIRLDPSQFKVKTQKMKKKAISPHDEM